MRPVDRHVQVPAGEDAGIGQYPLQGVSSGSLGLPGSGGLEGEIVVIADLVHIVGTYMHHFAHDGGRAGPGHIAKGTDEAQLHLLAGAGGQLVASQHNRCAGTIGPLATHLSIADTGGEAHTGEFDILGIVNFKKPCAEIRKYPDNGNSRWVAIMVANMEKTQLSGKSRSVHGADTILPAITWIISTCVICTTTW